MNKVTLTILILGAVFCTVLPRTSIANISGDASLNAPDKNAKENEKENGEYELVTGLDFSYWAGDTENIYGPGLNLGLLLIPRHLELTFSIGAMTGTTWHVIPLEMSFDVPFYVLEWLSLYVNFGPSVMNKKTAHYTEITWAISAGAGVEFLPIGFDWGIYAEFDYNYKFGKHIEREDEDKDKDAGSHLYGFTAGFNYRF